MVVVCVKFFLDRVKNALKTDKITEIHRIFGLCLHFLSPFTHSLYQVEIREAAPFTTKKQAIGTTGRRLTSTMMPTTSMVTSKMKAKTRDLGLKRPPKYLNKGLHSKVQAFDSANRKNEKYSPSLSQRTQVDIWTISLYVR